MASAARFLPSCLPEQYLAPPRYNLSSSDNLPAMKIKAMVFLLALTLPALATAQEKRSEKLTSAILTSAPWNGVVVASMPGKGNAVLPVTMEFKTSGEVIITSLGTTRTPETQKWRLDEKANTLEFIKADKKVDAISRNIAYDDKSMTADIFPGGEAQPEGGPTLKLYLRAADTNPKQ